MRQVGLALIHHNYLDPCVRCYFLIIITEEKNMTRDVVEKIPFEEALDRTGK